MNDYLTSFIICANFFFCVAFFIYVCNKEIQEKEEKEMNMKKLKFDMNYELNNIVINEV